MTPLDYLRGLRQTPRPAAPGALPPATANRMRRIGEHDDVMRCGCDPAVYSRCYNASHRTTPAHLRPDQHWRTIEHRAVQDLDLRSRRDKGVGPPGKPQPLPPRAGAVLRPRATMANMSSTDPEPSAVIPAIAALPCTACIIDAKQAAALGRDIPAPLPGAIMANGMLLCDIRHTVNAQPASQLLVPNPAAEVALRDLSLAVRQ